MEAFSSTGLIPGPFPDRGRQYRLDIAALNRLRIWPVHPENSLAVRADWVDKHPQATIAPASRELISRRKQWARQPENKMALAQSSASRAYFNTPLPFPCLAGPQGQYKARCRPCKTSNDPNACPL